MATTSPFLSLPGELRNRIYEWATVDIKYLVINHDGAAQPPALMQTCRQVRQEMRKLADQDLGDSISLRATVLNCDFAHVVRFLDQFRPVFGAPSVRNLTITLKLTHSPFDGLRLWMSAIKDIAAELNDDTREIFLKDKRSYQLRIRYVDDTNEANACSMFVRRTGEHLLDYLDDLTDTFRNICDTTDQFHAVCYSLSDLRSAFFANWYRVYWQPGPNKQMTLLLRPKVVVNHAAFRGVSKERRPRGRLRCLDNCILRERLVRTKHPRPHLEHLKCCRSKRRLEGENGTLAKLLRTLNLRDQCRAHFT